MLRTHAAWLLVALTACSATPTAPNGSDDDDGTDDTTAVDGAIPGADASETIDAPTIDAAAPPVDAPSAINCATRPPPAGWTRRTSGQIQSYGSSDTTTGEFYLFNVADSTKFANMFGFNDRIAPLNAQVESGSAPYTEKVGDPTPIIHPEFPAHPGTNALFGFGPKKQYYAMEFTTAAFPDASGAQSLQSYFTGSSSNHGTVSTLSISECPGDFGTDLNSATGKCLVDNFFGEGKRFSFEAGYDPTSSVGMSANLCHLKPGVKYYLNIAAGSNGDWSKSSCAANEWCWTTMISIAQVCPGAPNDGCDPYINGN